MNLPSPTPPDSSPSTGGLTTVARIPDEDLDARPGAPEPPIQIPRYRIVAQLGSGGMGTVYEARNALDNPVAIKVIRPDRVSETFALRFREEAKSMQQLRHSNIPRVLDYDVIDGWPYFAMELIRGSTLAERLDTFAGNPLRAVGLFLKVVDAVAYLHERGKLHRDLKPQNVLLDETGEPFLTDFGLVKEFDADEATHNPRPPSRGATSDDPVGEATRLSPHARAGLDKSLTATGAQIGTRPYMSPEQVDGLNREIGPATDIWAMGVMLYELLAQSRPFEADTVTVLEDAIRHSEPRPLPRIAVTADAELNRVVGRCLAKRPGDRYRDARELHADLLRWHRRATRKPRRRLLMVSLSAVALLAAGILLFAPAPSPLERIQREFRDRGEVRLASAAGPRWGEEFGRGRVEVPFDPDYWPLETTRTTFVDLYRGEADRPFRLAATLRVSGPYGEGGLFVGHRDFEPRGGDRPHTMLLAKLYREDGPLRLAVLPASFSVGEKVASNMHSSLRSANPVPVDDEGWCRLEFEVRPTTISLRLGDKEVFRETRTRIQGWTMGFGRNGKGWDHVTPTFDLTDGHGVYVHKGRLEIREVVVTALD